MPDESDEDDTTYEVTVWDLTSGDVVKKLWRASESDLQEIEEYYGSEPMYEIVVERRA